MLKKMIELINRPFQIKEISRFLGRSDCDFNNKKDVLLLLDDLGKLSYALEDKLNTTD